MAIAQPQQPTQAINKPRTIMIYGPSGSTKTSQAYHLAKWIHKTTGLRGRFIGSNASDTAPFEDSGMIEKGIVDFFDISSRQFALAEMRWLSKGFWPRDAKAKADGPVLTKAYFRKDEHCETKPEEWAKIGFYIIEGLTGVSTLLLNHCRSQDEGVGFKHSIKYEEEGEVIGGLSEGHYGIVQQELYKMVVQGFACLPVKYVIWTALIGKGEDKRKSETVYGPKGAGNASTFEIPSWYHDSIYLDKVNEMTKVEGSTEEREVERKVAWIVDHNDPDTSIPYPAKVRIMPELHPDLIRKFPQGFVRLGYKKGLEVLYEEMTNLVSSNTEARKEAEKATA